MTRGDTVIWLPSPWAHGTGEIKGVGKHGWLWVEFADGQFDQYDPQMLELATDWEQRQAGPLEPDMFTETG